MNLDHIDEALSGGGAKSAFTKESPLGSRVAGIILSADVQQIKDFVSGKPKFWDDGRPQEQIVVSIQTDIRENEDDKGIRGIYIKTWGVWKEALMEAVRGAGCAKVSQALAPGGTFGAEFTGTKPSSQGSDTKLYRYSIQPAQASALDAMGADTSTGELPPQQAPQPVAQQAVPQPAVQAAPPVQQVPAPAAAPDPIATARQLIALGIDDQTIAANTGLDPVVIAALKSQAA
ncbi:hypothetical protein [Arthrobacter sp. N1]|uniref:hypothetical protein n=1 Tax=Arthrobacter sp. N1 TaxID=619291 RepID=UPI003BAFA2C4